MVCGCPHSRSNILYVKDDVCVFFARLIHIVSGRVERTGEKKEDSVYRTFYGVFLRG